MNRILLTVFFPILLVVALPQRVDANKKPWPETYPQPAGIVWSMRLENVNQDLILRVMTSHLGAAIVSEANDYSCPRIVAKIHALNPGCRVGLEVSSWGGWTKPSQYWPLRSALGQAAAAHDWWLRYTDGTPVVLENGLGLVDLTNPLALAWYLREINTTRERLRPDFLFFDECHGTLGFLPRANEIRLAGAAGGSATPPAVRDSLWTLAMTKLLTGTGGGHMINGTYEPWRARAAIAGVYIQNALSGFDWDRVLRITKEWERPFIIVESPCRNAEQERRLVAIASLLGAGYQITPDVGWGVPMPQPWEAGSWGKATSSPSQWLRNFERARVERTAKGIRVVGPE